MPRGATSYGVGLMGLFSRTKTKKTAMPAVVSVDPVHEQPTGTLAAFAARRFPDTPYSYGESQPWLKHAVDASYWVGSEAGNDDFMAAQLGMTAVALAPRDQLASAAADLQTALGSMATHGAEDEPCAQSLVFLTEVVESMLSSGWLEEPWTSPYQGPSTEADVAWRIFPGAVIALLTRAERAGHTDTVAHYQPIAVQRLRPMLPVLPAYMDVWLSEHPSDTSQ